MRRGTTEYALGVNFKLDGGIVAHLPLGADDKLLNPNFDLPFSFIYGDYDWVMNMDEGFSKLVVQKRQDPTKYKYITVPDSNHNLMMDNPLGLSNAILNEALGIDRFPIKYPIDYTDEERDVDLKLGKSR